MKLRTLTLLIVSATLTTTAFAQSVFTAKLGGFQEAPAVVSAGTGHARLTISDDKKSITWELTYSGLEGSTIPNGQVTQAHVHVGQPNVSGGVAVFFCGGPLPPGPITRPACPAFGTISGTWHAEDVVGPTTQGVDPANPNNENAFERLIKAIRSGRAYANVHSTRSPAGEIRGQLVRADDDNDNESHDR
jgi:hypothetical protein